MIFLIVIFQLNIFKIIKFEDFRKIFFRIKSRYKDNKKTSKVFGTVIQFLSSLLGSLWSLEWLYFHSQFSHYSVEYHILSFEMDHFYNAFLWCEFVEFFKHFELFRAKIFTFAHLFFSKKRSRFRKKSFEKPWTFHYL